MKSVMKHNFSQIPSVSIPRSVFNRSHGHKTTLNSGRLVPIYVDEALPGDTFNMNANVMARMTTPLVPIMDNLFLDTFYFAVPNRLVWENWEDFITGGAHTVPLVEVDDEVNMTVFDYMGCPTNVATGTFDVNALPFRAYNLIYNEWFRPQDIVTEETVNVDDGPDPAADYEPLIRAKRHDYFTSALPWPQKGTAVELPLGTTAPVVGNGNALGLGDGHQNFHQSYNGATMYGRAQAAPLAMGAAIGGSALTASDTAIGVLTNSGWSGLEADLSAATAATINSIREAFQLQRMLEKDARGGTRYTEVIRSHFGVVSPDARLQRPEYLGGSTQRIAINPVAQTSETNTTAQGTLAGYGVVHDSKGRFNKSFTEHSIIIGLACIRADLTYQQGLNRMFSRQTRYDYYWPSLANLGEQEILNKEIYTQGLAIDEDVFGYQERFAEYRYYPSKITGTLRSTDPAPLDMWHLSQEFGALPTLNSTFINEAVPMDRILAIDPEVQPEFKMDCYFDLKCVRPMPVYGVPGMIDHF